MGLLQQREPVAPAAPEHAPGPPGPRGAGRARRLLALAAALAALVAFTTLARPQVSPSSRLVIGESDGAAVEDGLEGGAPGSTQPDVLLRSLDPSTLADVPTSVLGLGEGAWPILSEDGALLAVPDLLGSEFGTLDVVDARTFQPTATIELVCTPISGLVGFTPEADALIVQCGAGGRQTLTRYPLDPQQGATEVEVPGRLDIQGQPSALLPAGRLALLAGERGGGNVDFRAWTPHVLVVDLLAERIAVDLALPDVLFHQAGEVVGEGSQFSPGLAWDAAGERLYLAHAEAPRVTVVDLAAGRISAEVDLDSGAPGSDDLPVDANRRKTAVLSPDGSRLYVTGRDYLRDGPGPALGLSVVDTRSLSEIGYVSRVSDWMQVSPDGRWLAWTAQTIGGPAGGVPFSRVGLLDTETLEQVALLGNGYRASQSLGFSLDSAHFYLSSDDDVGRSVIRAHALPSLEQTGERRLPAGGWFEPRGAYLRASG